MNQTINNYKDILNRIRKAEAQYHRPKDSVELIAVSKTFPTEKVMPLIKLGQRHFAENYVQEAIPKISELQSYPLIWHFIGRIQTNKCQLIAEYFDWVHTIYRLKEVQALSKFRHENKSPLNICLQIKLDDLDNRPGLTPPEVQDFVKKLDNIPNILLKGLMVLPKPELDFASQRKCFKIVREIGEALKEQGYAIDTYSMGMTQDLEAAIAEGTTFVRVGRGIFGER